jgi:hypothetical protein
MATQGDTMTDQTPILAQAREGEVAAKLPPLNPYSVTLLTVGIVSLVLAVFLWGYGSSQYSGGELFMALGAGFLPFGGLSLLLWLTVGALSWGK